MKKHNRLTERLCTLIIVIAVCISAVPQVFAESYVAYSRVYPEVYAGIKTAVDNMEPSYTMPSGYHVKPEELFGILEEMGRTCAMHFTRDGGCSYYTSVYGGQKYVTRVLFSYAMTESEAETATRTVNDFIDGIISAAPQGMSDFEKVLYYHDYLANIFIYDYDFLIYDVFSMISGEKGVCQAYTLLYGEVLNRAGIETSWASSDGMDHIWNCVKLGDSWYHVDLTWDSAPYGYPGGVVHDYFLLSDEELLQTDHYGWVSPVTCGSSYGDLYVRNITTAVAPLGDLWYYLDGDGNLCALDDPSSDSAGDVVSPHGMTWRVWGQNAYYAGIFGTVCAYNGLVCYTSPTKIMAYDPASGLESALYSYTGGEGYIYGMKLGGYTPYADEGEAVINVSQSPGLGEYVTVQVTLIRTIPGDVNGDGEVNASDVNVLNRYIAGFSVTVNTAAADVNGDGEVGSSDANLLLRFIAGYSVDLAA